MTPVIAHARKFYDQCGYTIQRPTVAVKTMCPCPAPESSGQTPLLLPIEFRLSTRTARAFQRPRAILLPLLIPSADALAADLKFTGNGGLRHLLSQKILSRAQAPRCHAAEISSRNYRSGHNHMIKQIRHNVLAPAKKDAIFTGIKGCHR